MIMVVRSERSLVMSVRMVYVDLMEVFVLMVVTIVAMLMHMGMLVVVGMGVWMRMHDVPMPVFVRMNMPVHMGMSVVVRMAMGAFMTVVMLRGWHRSLLCPNSLRELTAALPARHPFAADNSPQGGR